MTKPKRRLLILGCGDVGLRAARMLRSAYRIYALTRSSKKSPALRALGIIPVRGDLDNPRSLGGLAGLAQHVLHFAPPQNSGLHDRRTRNLLAALDKGEILPQRLIYISTSGVYGDCAGELVAETRPPRPSTPRAKRRWDGERQLQKWGRRRGVNVSILRVPGIYADNRLPLERLKKGTPALRAEEDVYTNHIHAEDLARAAAAALRYGKPGRVYNVSDDAHMKMGAYFDLVADSFGLPRPPRISRVEAPQQMSANLLSFMAESRRLVNTRMKRELRVRLIYPDVQEALMPGRLEISE